jgi:aerobic-type carbon monoxide dehydrogenase small subunit (CoxS/CutS family)
MAAYVLRVNGRTHRVEGEPGDSLLSVLRYDLGLTGSKFGCGEGYCGACTVLLGGQPTRSCTLRLAGLTDQPITTIEGIAENGKLHAVQEAFLEAEAFQCGYCTPGMVIAVIGLLNQRPNPSDAEIAKVLDRNVCRCGTYPRIVRAIQLAAEKLRASRG